MKRYLALFFALLITPVAGKDLAIGVVDLSRVFNEYTEFQQAKRDLDRYVLEWERQRDSIKAYIDSLKTALEIEKPGLTEKGKEKRELEIKKAQETYTSFIKSIWGDEGLFFKKSEELLTPYYQKIQTTIKKVAEANNLDLVLNKTSDNLILYISNSKDITDLVLQELNRTYAQMPEQKMKYRIAIFPILEENADAQKFQLGTRLQRSIYQSIVGNLNFEVLGISDVNAEISKRNLTTDRLFPENCQQIALSLNSDYFICGSVQATGDNVDFTYEIYKTSTMERVIQVTGTATNLQENLDAESIQKAKLLIQQFKP